MFALSTMVFEVRWQRIRAEVLDGTGVPNPGCPQELNRAYTDVIPVGRAVNMAYGHCPGVSGCQNLNGRPYVVHLVHARASEHPSCPNRAMQSQSRPHVPALEQLEGLTI